MRMHLIHMPDTFDRSSTTIPCLEQGQVIELPD
jgi:hypothetical protein